MMDTSTLVGGGDREKSTSFIVRTQLWKITINRNENYRLLVGIIPAAVNIQYGDDGRDVRL